MNKLEHLNRSINKAIELGVTYKQYFLLRKEAKKLRNFYSRCCDDVSFDEEKGYYIRYCRDRGEVIGRYRDYETGSINRIAEVINDIEGVGFYIQSDPRGETLYLYKVINLQGNDISSCYNSIGVCIVSD